MTDEHFIRLEKILTEIAETLRNISESLQIISTVYLDQAEIEDSTLTPEGSENV